MSLPRFLDRIVDATAPALDGLDRAAVTSKLESTSISLVAGEKADVGTAREGFLLAANLLARLYPSIAILAPDELARAAEAEITLINPVAEVTTTPPESQTAALLFEPGEARIPVDTPAVAVFARGWNVYVDDPPSEGEPVAGPAALLAAVLGVSEVFRIVFADELGERGRRGRQPSALNLITLSEPEQVEVPDDVDIGEARLVGSGAIGQAAALALAVAGARGTLLAVDHEKVALSNLQRYVLARDSDVGEVKVDLLRERLAGSGLEVVPVPAEWHVGLVEAQLPTLVALDSAEARIGVQASLPGPLYNAWTQPADVGWSRHEHFGETPCLACLYWPTDARPNRHEQIAEAFRQHPLRVLGYLVHRLPVGLPLPPGGIPSLPAMPAPPEADEWLARPIADDIATAAGIDASELAAWRDRSLADVYQDGICGGALLHLNVGEAPREVLVPLAHQSVFAGVMLATQLIVAAVPGLKERRSTSIEGRYNVLAGLPQVMPRPRNRAESCICGDAVFRDVYGVRFGVESGEVA
ncbi:MAG TPA: ThiF family adenylyltransferase [Gaiellaceae bacterium]